MFSLNPPRHPLARLALGLAGLVLLGMFTAFGLVVAATLALGYAVRRLFLGLRGVSPGDARPADPKIIDGEFSVVEKPRHSLNRK